MNVCANFFSLAIGKLNQLTHCFLSVNELYFCGRGLLSYAWVLLSQANSVKTAAVQIRFGILPSILTWQKLLGEQGDLIWSPCPFFPWHSFWAASNRDVILLHIFTENGSDSPLISPADTSITSYHLLPYGSKLCQWHFFHQIYCPQC